MNDLASQLPDMDRPKPGSNSNQERGGASNRHHGPLQLQPHRARKLGLMLLQLVLHRCYLNLRFPAVAQSIAPFLSQLNRIEAERQVQLEQKLVEFPVAGTGRLFADNKRIAGSA